MARRINCSNGNTAIVRVSFDGEQLQRCLTYLTHLRLNRFCWYFIDFRFIGLILAYLQILD